MVGHVIAYAAISTGAGTTVQGQLISLTAAVTLGGTSIVNSGCAAPVVTAPVATPVVTPTATPVATTAPVVTPTAKPVATATPKVSSTPVETGTAVTVTGGELPKTASPFANFLFAGGSLMLIGVVGLATRTLLMQK